MAPLGLPRPVWKKCPLFGSFFFFLPPYQLTELATVRSSSNGSRARGRHRAPHLHIPFNECVPARLFMFWRAKSIKTRISISILLLFFFYWRGRALALNLFSAIFRRIMTFFPRLFHLPTALFGINHHQCRLPHAACTVTFSLSPQCWGLQLKHWGQLDEKAKGVASVIC